MLFCQRSRTFFCFYCLDRYRVNSLNHSRSQVCPYLSAGGALARGNVHSVTPAKYFGFIFFEVQTFFALNSTDVAVLACVFRLGLPACVTGAPLGCYPAIPADRDARAAGAHVPHVVRVPSNYWSCNNVVTSKVNAFYYMDTSVLLEIIKNWIIV